METCHEYFDCKNKSCLMFEMTEVNCWQVENTMCLNHGAADLGLSTTNLEQKLEVCQYCIYYMMRNRLLA